MSELEGIVTYTFLWKASANPCPICAALNGKVITGQDLFAHILFADGKPIWNLDADHSLAHGYARFNCRCSLEVRAEVDLSKAEWFTKLLGEVQRA